MPTPQIQNDPIYSLPYLYKYGLTISNDATTPNTVLDISSGQCRDQNDVIDITVGSPNVENFLEPAALTINAAINGAGGLDTGALAQATMYAIYIIADSRYYQQTAAIATLASNSVPLLPFGYDSYRLIGYWSTVSNAADWTLGYYTGLYGDLQFTYAIPQATAVTAGNSTFYVNVALTNIVPPAVALGEFYCVFTPAVAGHQALLRPFAATAVGTGLTGQVATVRTSGTICTVITLDAGAPVIQYEVTASGDALAINVFGFSVSV
jgi:hypothetical protein